MCQRKRHAHLARRHGRGSRELSEGGLRFGWLAAGLDQRTDRFGCFVAALALEIAHPTGHGSDHVVGGRGRDLFLRSRLALNALNYFYFLF